MNASLSGAASLDEDGPAPVVNSYDLSAHQTLSRVILLIRENYVEPDRIKPYDMFLAALDYIQKTVPEVLVDDSDAPEQVRVAVGTRQQVFDLGGLDQLWEVTMALRDIFRFLQSHIVDSGDRRDIEYAAINGMLSTLDPHSVLLKPESFNEVKLSTKGEFGGLGIVISIRDGKLTIISPIPTTPAARVGLKAKDHIVKIDDESTVNMTLEEAVQRLRGKPGSKVAIWILRKNWTEPKRFVLARAIIKIESVTSKLLEDGVGYIRIKSFQNNTYDDLHTHLKKLRDKNRGELRGLVLDLRNNPGGLLDQAILVSDRFIDRGPLVITVGEGNRKREVKPAHFSGTETSYPVAVLVNGGSASASEIVAGALKNHNRAVIIGQQTFGKGSVQVLYDFKDKSALKLTIAQYLTPGDVSIQSVGITPDIEVLHASVAKDELHLFSHDDTPREKDLDKHLNRHGGTVKSDQDKPFARITHYVPEEDQEKADEQGDSGDAFVYDFETKLAHDALIHTNSASRRAFLEQSQALFQRYSQDEDLRIASQLGSLGADWSPGLEVSEAKVEGSVDIATGAQAKAGDTVKIIGTAKNPGLSALHRVHAVSASDNPLLNHLEFAFGKLEPGESKTWEVDVKLPDDMSPRADELTLNFEYQHGELKSSTAAVVAIDEQQKPRFAYTTRIDDRAKGNGDGLLQVGEVVDLEVDVTNLGPGTAEEAMVTVKNNTGKEIYLDRGREKLGELSVGARKTGTLRFTVRERVARAELRIAIWDNKLGGSLSEVVVVPMGRPLRAKNELRSLKVGRDEVPIYAGASDESALLAHAKPNATLRSDVSFGQEGQWRRVDLTQGLFGFVRASDVTVTRGSRKASKAAVRLSRGQAAPDIELSLAELTTSDASLRLSGTVSDEHGLMDLFVFVNDKKVAYESLREIAPIKGMYSSPFDVTVPLDKGSNAVALVVRENDELVARKIFGIFRGEAAALARLKARDGKTAH